MSDGQIGLNLKVNGLAEASNQIENFSKRSQMALTSLNQVVQDLPFGFIGIQNNLPVLAQQFGTLVKETGGITAAFKSLGSTLISPTGIIFGISAITAGITLLIQKYGSLGEAFDAIFSSQKQLTESQKEIINNIAEESTKVFTLYGLYTNLNDNRLLQDEVLKKLNKAAPEYFKNLDSETNKIEQLNIATDKYIKSLLGKIFVETQQAQVTEILKKYGEELNNVVDTEINLAKQRDKDKNQVKNQLELINRLSESQKNLSDISVPITPVIPKKTTTELIQDISDRLKTDITSLFGATKKFADVLNLDDLFGKDKTKKSINNTDKLVADSNKRQETAFNILKEAYIATLTDREKELYRVQDEYEQKRAGLLRANIFDFALIEEEKLIRIREIVAKYDEIDRKAREKKAKEEFELAQDQIRQVEKLSKNAELIIPPPKIKIDYTQLGFSEEITNFLQQGFKIEEAIKKVQNGYLETGRIIYSNVINPLNELFNVVLSNGQVSWDEFTKSVVQSLTKLYAKLAATAAIAALISLASGGGSTVGGLSFGQAFGSLFGFRLGRGGVANPGFSGIQGGGMQMAGQVNLVLRGQDLVGSLNRTNSQFSRVG